MFITIILVRGIILKHWNKKNEGGFLNNIEAAYNAEFNKLWSEMESIDKHSSTVERIVNLLNGTDLYGTIIVDSYTRNKDDVYSIFTSLNSVCNPYNVLERNWKFDSYGVYFFWDFYTKEILYIGVTNSLTRRFGEHNGIGNLSVEGLKGNSKFFEIRDYFNSNKEKLGYSILVQDSFDFGPSSDFPDKTKEMFTIESALLEEYKQKFSQYPRWNKAPGRKYGRNAQSIDRYGNIFDMVTLNKIDFLNAKSTLREIQKDEEIRAQEYYLNAVRSAMYKHNWTFSQSLYFLIKFAKLNYKYYPEQETDKAVPECEWLVSLAHSPYLQKVVKL